MIFRIHPVETVRGSIPLPSSKSYSIRALIIAACGGESTIISPSDCDDAQIAIKVAKALGAEVTPLRGQRWKVSANKNRLRLSKVNVGESGTVLRFLIPLAAFLTEKSVITGKGTLIGRPNQHLLKTLRKMGFAIKGKGQGEAIPIEIQGGHFQGGLVEINGTISSQFVSALMIACSLLPDDSRLLIQGKRVVSQDYLTMTRQVLSRSGVQVRKQGSRIFKIRGGQKFKGIKNFEVPADYGLAAFFLAAAALLKSKVTLKGFLSQEFIQSDGEIFPLLRKMGVHFEQSKSALRISGPFALKGGVFSLRNCPDLLPILAVMALFAKGKTRFCDIQHARVKESDRISDLRSELLKVGAKITEKKDEICIIPQPSYRNNCLLDPHQDHRLAMAFSILGLKIGVRVKDIECVRKSYPGFVGDLKSLIP